MAPRAFTVASPVPVFGLNSVECYTQGTLRFEHPVDAGKTVTVSIQVRKTASYFKPASTIARGDLGYKEITSHLPFLRLTRADGKITTDVMVDVNDTWDTLQSAMPILADGVLLIELVQLGARGDQSIFLTQAQAQAYIDNGPRVWWADLKAVAS